MNFRGDIDIFEYYGAHGKTVLILNFEIKTPRGN